MVHRHTAPALLTALVIGGGSFFAVAQFGPDDDRRLPYQGTLESAGAAAASGLYTLRFGLFLDRDADAACLVSDPTTCSLWGEEQSVEVSEGRFSVALGDSEGIPDTVLAQPGLFLSIAVNGPDDGATFTLLDAKQEILAVPFAARAAAARDYKVTGTLTANAVDATSATIDSAFVGALEADEVNVNDLRLLAHGEGLQLRPDADPSSGFNLFSVRSSDGTNRLRVEHNGETEVTNNLRVNGSAVITGALNYGCGSGWVRVGAWCIENQVRGQLGINYTQALNACHNVGANVCPIGALLACDSISPSGAVCSSTLDEDRWLWTSGINAADDVSAFENIRVFNGRGNDVTNEADVADSSVNVFADGPVSTICCRPGGGL